MFCPNCGIETNQPLKFCKQCGLNLKRVQGVIGKEGAGGKTVNSPASWERLAMEEYQEERDHKRKKTPEEKRIEEVRGGVITASIGLGLMIFFNLLFDAIANTIQGPQAAILRSLWGVGLVPFLVGLGFIFNGLVVSKRLIEMKKQQHSSVPQPLFQTVPSTSPVPQLPETSQAYIADHSITESTTTRLREPIPGSTSPDTN